MKLVFISQKRLCALHRVRTELSNEVSHSDVGGVGVSRDGFLFPCEALPYEFHFPPIFLLVFSLPYPRELW